MQTTEAAVAATDATDAATTTAKEHVRKALESLPDDATYEEVIREVGGVIRELAFSRMVERGLADIRAGRFIDDEEMGRLIDKWYEEKNGENNMVE